MNLFCNSINILPFDWAHYQFMKNALAAIILIAPLYALIGTIVVNNRMSFFSDVLGHSALTGIAFGVILGIAQPFWAMLTFMIIAAVMINVLKNVTQSSSDTALGVFFAIAVGAGVAILSKGGGFNKFTVYLIGDILTVSSRQIMALGLILFCVVLYWFFFGNNLILMSVNPVLARSRGIHVFLMEISFSVLLAIVVALSIRMTGILIINSLLILPAAAARNIAGNIRGYVFFSIVISLVSGVSGLITSYYAGTAAGATIVLFCAGFYVLSAGVRKYRGQIIRRIQCRLKK